MTELDPGQRDPAPEAHWRDVAVRPLVAGYYVTEPDRSPQDWSRLYQPRPHHQLWLTEAGSGWLSLGGPRHSLRPGGVLPVPPGRPCSGGHDPGASLRVYVVMLEVRVAGDETAEGLAWLPPGLRLPPRVWAQAAAAVDELIAELAGRRPGHAALASAAATRLLGICWREAAEQGVLAAPAATGAAGAAGPARLHPVLEHIAAHFSEPLTLGVLADVAHFSASHLCTAFRRELGLPPLEYVRRFRLARAKDLFTEGRLGVAEVAGAVGFPDASHFSRVFRRCEGVTPAAYRAKRRHLVT